MHARLSVTNILLITAVATASSWCPAMAEDDMMMGQMAQKQSPTTAPNHTSSNHSASAQKRTTNKQMGAMGDMHGMMGQMGSSGGQMGGMGNMHGKMGQMGSGGNQMGGMGNMHGKMGQMGSGGNQMGGMDDMHGMMGQMGSGGNQMGGMGDMHGMMGQMGSGGAQMGGMGDMHGKMGQMGSGGNQMGGMGDMHGMMGQMGSGGSQMGGMGDMHGMMGQMGSGGSQTAGMTKAQDSGDMSEHAKHHGGSATSEESRTPAQTTSVLPAPQASIEDQMKIQELANKRMETGTTLMTQGIVSLSNAKQKSDVRSMEQATRQIRDGLSQFESGLSAQRALSEGMAPRDVGLRWFKEQMNLTSARSEHGGDILGISWFHFFVMVALIAFAVIMIWMYFFKMRRAAEVLGRATQPASQETGKQKPETSASKP